MKTSGPVSEPGAARRRRFRGFKRLLLFLLPLLALIPVARPVWHLARAHLSDYPDLPPPPKGHLDDAGRLSLTPIDSIIEAPRDPDSAAARIRDLIREAGRTGRRISIAGARHSMGGHTLHPHALVLDMRACNRLEADTARNTLHAGAGALWSDILRHLDTLGRSVEVMQGNSSFTVGGSLSVNCHGWQADHGPIASTVRSFRLILADGSLVRCSREENPELFSLALGGYGLFGVILDAELEIVPNEAYRFERRTFPAGEYLAHYRGAAGGKAETGLAYGRLDVSPGRFLGEGTVNVFLRTGDRPEALAGGPSWTDPLVRAVFRGSAGSAFGKGLRWTLEQRLQPLLFPDRLSRNRILLDEASLLANRSPHSTDILQEYFIPADSLRAFIAAMRETIPRHPVPDLLNVTVRNVLEDRDTFLRYAREEVFGLVLSYQIPATPEGDRALAALARELIDRALALGGTFYLPYRPHATPEQLGRAYPGAALFFDRKRKYDPGEIFRNGFYEAYGHALVAGSPSR